MRETSSSPIMSTVNHQTVERHTENDGVLRVADAGRHLLRERRWLGSGPAEEPYERIVHVRICGGPGYKPKPRAVRQRLYGGSPGSTQNADATAPSINLRAVASRLRWLFQIYQGGAGEPRSVLWPEMAGRRW